MAIDTPTLIAFSNHAVRPLANNLSALIVTLEAIGPDVDMLLPQVPNDPNEIVMDGRENEGVPRMTGADVHMLAQFRTTILSLRSPELDGVIARARTRPPQVSI